MRGGVSEIRRTATESALMQDAANARTSDKLATVERAMAEVGRRLVKLAQQFMTGEQVARIVSKDGDPVWIKYDRDYLAGDFDFEIVGGSTQPVNESFRRQTALQVVDAMAPFAAAGVVDMRKMAAYVLQFGFGIKSPQQFMQEPPPPMPPEGAGGGMPPQMSLPAGVQIPSENPTVPQQAEAGMAGFEQGMTI
jgi:hypothetical protein